MLKPEFALLDKYYKRLYSDHEITPELLEKIKKHIIYCAKIAHSDKEKAVLKRAKHYWLEKVGLTEEQAFPAKSHVEELKEGLTEYDEKFLEVLERNGSKKDKQ